MQRHKGSLGYFSGDRFANALNPKEITDEIALNPAHFARRKPEEVLSTLAHEMAHLWRHHRGSPPRQGYHDRQWADKMVAIGLIPSASGEKGGAMTGQKVTHLIEKEGLYARTVSGLLKEHQSVLYADRPAQDTEARKKKAASKAKYTCPGCGVNAWAKPDVSLCCGTCQMRMQSKAPQL